MLLATMPSLASSGGVDAVPAHPGAAVAEVFEGDRFDGDHVRETLEFEGLDGEVVLPDDVEDAVEGVLLALAVPVDVPVAAAGAEVVALDVHLIAVGAQPLLDQVRLRVGAENRSDRGVEFARRIR